MSDQLVLPAGYTIRPTIVDDAPLLQGWLSEPGMDISFPLSTPQEIEDASKRWVAFARYGSAMTVLYDGIPVGLAALYLVPYRTLSHQCEWGLVISTAHQGKKVGKPLCLALFELAKNRFKIELLHLQVFERNTRGIAFFKSLGFREWGRQTHWMKRDGVYYTRVMMERFL